MKIISSYKDYYDYIVGIYSIDEKIIYERICHRGILKNKKIISLEKRHNYVPVFPNYNDSKAIAKIKLHICGEIFEALYLNKKFYFLPLEKKDYFFLKENGDNFSSFRLSHKGHRFFNFMEKHRLNHKKININQIFNCPVILEEGQGIYILNVKLSDFGLPSIMPAKKIYQKIYEFLIREPDIIDNRTDQEKILGHGFDLRKSFRNRKK